MSYNSNNFWKVVHVVSFKTNQFQQLSLEDSFMNLTDRERKALEKLYPKSNDNLKTNPEYAYAFKHD